MARRVIPIRGDGNCLFRSVSFCIYGCQDRHREIRLRVVERVVQNWHRYKDFIIGDRSYGFHMHSASDYQALMSSDGEYAGHVELHCISELYPEYTFKIHRDSCPKTIDYGRGRNVKHLLFSGYLDAGHYSVLEYYWHLYTCYCNKIIYDCVYTAKSYNTHKMKVISIIWDISMGFTFNTYSKKKII